MLSFAMSFMSASVVCGVLLWAPGILQPHKDLSPCEAYVIMGSVKMFFIFKPMLYFTCIPICYHEAFCFVYLHGDNDYQ